MDCLYGINCNCIIYFTNDRVMKKEEDAYEEKITKFEKYVNLVWGVLARNWGKLIVLSVLTVIVWFCYLVKNEVENPKSIPDYVQEPAPEEYLGNPAVVEQMQAYGEDTTSTTFDDSVY